MNNNKGITIISLIIYIIVLSIVIGTTSMLMKYFYSNTEEAIISKQTANQYSRFVAYLTDDINSGKINDVEVKNQNQLIFTLNDNSQHKYVFENENIYYIVKNNKDDNDNKSAKYIKLCEKIDSCVFKYESNKIFTNIKIGEIVYNNNFSIQ